MENMNDQEAQLRLWKSECQRLSDEHAKLLFTISTGQHDELKVLVEKFLNLRYIVNQSIGLGDTLYENHCQVQINNLSQELREARNEIDRLKLNEVLTAEARLMKFHDLSSSGSEGPRRMSKVRYKGSPADVAI